MLKLYEGSGEPTLPAIPLRDIQFQSLSEYACTKMLQRYCGYRPVPDVTFQIPVGRCYFDFLLGNCLVEYHPISLRHEVQTGLLHEVLSAAHFLSKDKKAALLEAVSDELAAQYQKRRSQVAAAHPRYADCEVICVNSVEEFVKDVVKRFAIVRPMPGLDELQVEFRGYLRDAKKGRERA